MSVTRTAVKGLALTALTTLAVGPAAAHSGTTHAQTPHWLLLVLTVVGLGIAGASWYAAGGGRVRSRSGLVGLFAGALVAGFGGIGLVEIQVVSTVGPALAEYYPLATLVVGSSVLIGSLLAGRTFWPRRPRYTALGMVLGGWILYPTLFPSEGVTNPLGYVLVLALPVTVAYVLRADASTLLTVALARRRTRLVAAGAMVLVVGFLAFSAGTLTINPDYGPAGPPAESFVTAIPVVSPLVYWPAVEFTFPSIPLAGMISVGTVILFGTLGALVALNVAIVATQWQAETEEASAKSMAGALATTGATACCCCAPAMYGVISAGLGAAASPVYWAFMDPTSPVGTFFLALSVTMLTASILQSANGEAAKVCVRAARERPDTSTPADSD